MPTNSGFQVNGADLTANWPDKSYLIDRYPELSNTLKQAGLWLCGINGNGSLGDNTTIAKSSPVQTVASGTDWKQVSSAKYTAGTVAAIKTDGTLWLWGRNNYGQLGTNDTTSRSSPVQTVASGTNWKQVSVGAYHVSAIKTDGTLWLWGRNNYGQLGKNNTTSYSSPIQTIASGTDWKQVSSGGVNTAAIKTDGTLWLWGDNYYGQIGNNSTLAFGSGVSSPVQTVASGTNWKQVSVGASRTTAAIKTDGTLWNWGCGDYYGALGTNLRTNYSSPVQTISGGTNWKLVDSGRYCTTAIKTDGTLWLWGHNGYGNLADGTTTHKSSPVQTISGGTNWKQVSCATHNTGAIKTDGTLWTWGLNANGQLGTNDVSNAYSPVQTITGGTNWKQISLSDYGMAAIRDDSSDPL